MALDRSYLKRHGNQWIVVVKVPDRLRPVVGKAHLKQPLHTDSLALANRDKFKHVAAMKAQLQEAEGKIRQKAGRPADAMLEEALEWRAEIASAADEPETPPGPDDDHNDGFSQKDWVKDRLAERAEELEKTEGYPRAKQFYETASGKATPISTLIEKWLAERPMKPRQTIDYRRAVLKFVDWLRVNKLPQSVEGCSRKIAGRYVTEAMVEAGVNWRTANKDISCLSSMWRWLAAKEYAPENVWREQSLAKKAPKKGEGKRPYTDAEMVKLFSGRPSSLVGDMMTIAALSGMRVDEIARLTVGDIFEGERFDITEAKTTAGIRMVPIHSALKSIIDRRTAGKEAPDALFPELPIPKPGSPVERSQKVTKRFGDYRKLVGVDDTQESARQSRVDFHSFRRWFITKAEQAHQPPHFISSLVGHKRSGETLGRYSAGPLVEQMQAVVESVRLPEGCVVGTAAE